MKTCNAEESKTILKIVRKDFKDGGYYAYRLHGCSGCNDYIWMFKESHVCPNCNNSDGRYNKLGAPVQEVFYFPLLPRLERMYKDYEWQQTIRYPDERPRRFYSRSDVFDGTVYKRIRRGVGKCTDFLALGYCADGVMVDKRMNRSVLPGILSILNYDPRLRQQATENMLLTFLLPPKIKTEAAQKFYALLEEELNQLYYTGVARGKLKGALIMVRADQKGKEFDLGLRAVTSYDAPCNFCELMANPGYGDFTATRVGDYRRFLPDRHPYRQDPSFGPAELRPAPAERTLCKSKQAVRIVQDPDIDLTHYQGYRTLPLFQGVKYFKPFDQSAADLSHNIANFFKSVMLTVCPTENLVTKWRLEAALSGRFPEIAPDFPDFLDPDVAQIFMTLDLDAMRVVDLEECAKLMGIAHTGLKAVLKARIQQTLREFNGLYLFRVHHFCTYCFQCLA